MTKDQNKVITTSSKKKGSSADQQRPAPMAGTQTEIDQTFLSHLCSRIEQAILPLRLSFGDVAIEDAIKILAKSKRGRPKGSLNSQRYAEIYLKCAKTIIGAQDSAKIFDTVIIAINDGYLEIEKRKIHSKIREVFYQEVKSMQNPPTKAAFSEGVRRALLHLENPTENSGN